MIASGVWLWLPKRWTWRHVKAALLYRSGLQAKARDWNWHNVTGIWCALPLSVLALTGVIMSYTWANNLLYRLSGSDPPKAAGRGGGGAGNRRLRSRVNRRDAPTNFGLFFTQGEKQVAGWRSIMLRLPKEASGAIILTIDSGNGGQPNKRGQLTLSPSGQVLKWEPFESLPLGRRLRSLARFAHTGEAGGLPGQIAATLAAAGGALLVWTGISLAWRRGRKAMLKKTDPKDDAVLV